MSQQADSATQAPFVNRREFHRYETTLSIHAVQGDLSIPCILRDISGGGARLEFDAISRSFIDRSKLQLDIPDIGLMPAEIRWRTSRQIGISFAINPDRKKALEKRLAAKFVPG